MRIRVPLPDGIYTFHIEVYYPDAETLHSKTEVIPGMLEVPVKLPADPAECFIRVFQVHQFEPVSQGYVYLDGELRPYKPEIHKLSTAKPVGTDAPSYIQPPLEPAAASKKVYEQLKEEVLGPTLSRGEPLILDSTPSLTVVTETGIEPLEDEDPKEDETNE